MSAFIIITCFCIQSRACSKFHLWDRQERCMRYVEIAVVLQSLSHVQLFATPWTVAHQVLCPQDFPGKNTSVSCHFFLQVEIATSVQNQLVLPTVNFKKDMMKSDLPSTLTNVLLCAKNLVNQQDYKIESSSLCYQGVCILYEEETMCLQMTNSQLFF